MFKITIETKKGTPVFDQVMENGRCLLGKSAECDVRLHGWLLGKKHALFEMQEDGVHLTSFDTKVGVRVHGQQVGKYGPISNDDVFQIDSYVIRVKNMKRDNSGSHITSAQESESLPLTPTPNSPSAPVQTLINSSAIEQQERAVSERRKGVKELYQGARARVSRELLLQMDLRRINVSDMNDEQLRAFSEKMITDIVAGLGDIPPEIDHKSLIKQVLDEAVGLGPLEDLLVDESISEIMVNSWSEIFYEKNGKILESEISFTDERSVLAVIERIVAPLGRRIDESSPTVDARLKDGSRVNAVIPPVALKGACITIRKFTKEKLQGRHLVEFGSMTQDMVEFLQLVVRYKQNIVVSGGTGSGKTTLLNVLSNFIPQDERVITVEDSAELRLNIKNLISMESRPANQEGKGQISIRDLVRNCLRMRPDRIVVGECRGGEALDMLQAMNTGHDGSLTTVHANTPRDCVGRIEVMVMMAGMDLPMLAIRDQIASAVNIIIQQTRFSCGSRKVTSISEISGVEGNTIQLGEIFRYRPTGFDENGKVLGHFEATGLIPQLYEDLRERGLNLDLSIFQETSEAVS